MNLRPELCRGQAIEDRVFFRVFKLVNERREVDRFGIGAGCLPSLHPQRSCRKPAQIVAQYGGCGVVKASCTLVLALDFHKGIDGRKCLASWVKPLLVINVHGVDDPFFDMIKIHHGKGSRDIYNKLKA